MSRSVAEWIGKTDDTAIPKRVLDRVFWKHDGQCAKCGRPMPIGKWACDHIIALVNGGQHCERNLQPLCISPCHSDKTKADIKIKAKSARVRAKHLGIKPKGRPMPGSRASKFKKLMNGQVVQRNTGA